MDVKCRKLLVTCGLVASCTSVGLPAHPAQAQNPQSCAAIADNLRRLSCYDRYFQAAQPDQANTSGKGNKADAASPTLPSAASNSSRKGGLPQNATGKGDLAGGRFVPNLAAKSGKTEPASGAKGATSWSGSYTGDGGYSVKTLSKQQHRNIIGQQAPLELIATCEENTTSLSIRFGGNIVASVLNRFDIELSVDAKPPKTVAFSVSRDYKSVGIWKGSDSIPVLRTLFVGQELKLTGAPFFSEKVTAVFPIEGLENAIVPLREACSW